MNKLMRKLSISILAVVFAVVAMGATTFAWFTLTNTAKLDQFTVEVTTEEGVELSMDQTNWSSVITPTQFTAGLLAQKVTKPALTAVTTIDGTDGSFKTLLDLTSAGVATFDDATAGVDYFEFTIYIRTTTQNQPIYLSNANTDIEGTAINWTADKGFTPSTGVAVNAGGSLTVNPEDAVRMAVEGTAIHVFELPGGGTNTSGQGFSWTKGALNYYASKKGYANPTDPDGDASDHATTATVRPLGTAYTTAVAQTGSVAASGYYTTSVTVRIWLDGWDQECYNAIFGGVLNVKIGFTTDSSAA